MGYSHMLLMKTLFVGSFFPSSFDKTINRLLNRSADKYIPCIKKSHCESENVDI